MQLSRRGLTNLRVCGRAGSRSRLRPLRLDLLAGFGCQYQSEDRTQPAKASKDGRNSGPHNLTLRRASHRHRQASSSGSGERTLLRIFPAAIHHYATSVRQDHSLAVALSLDWFN